MSPVLDIQRRSQQIGRIRIGQQVKAASGKMRPDRLSTFRFTTASRSTADAVAELYGGEVRDWSGQFEVITGRSEIGVTVPPRNAVVSQWYEMWGRTIKRRCDSQHEQFSGGPCLCPHAEDPGDEEEVSRCALRRADMARANPPQACSLVTRINVMIPDLPGLGVWRLDTGSFHAAGESGDKADLMELARERNLFLPGSLRIEWRKRTTDAKPYPVPVLEITDTFRDIASGALEARGIMAQLPPPPGEQPKAITAGPAAEPAPPAAPAPAGPEIEPLDWQVAQLIYERALSADTRAGVETCAKEPEAQRLADEHVCTDTHNDVWEPLHDALQAIWREKAAEAS